MVPVIVSGKVSGMVGVQDDGNSVDMVDRGMIGRGNGVFTERPSRPGTIYDSFRRCDIGVQVRWYDVVPNSEKHWEKWPL